MMKLSEFKAGLDSAMRDLFIEQRASGDGSGVDDEPIVMIRIGQNYYKPFISIADCDRIILSIEDEYR